MEIQVRLDAVISLQDGSVNINEILYAVGRWCREMTSKLAEGVIDAYQNRIVEMLCAGRGEAGWLPHDVKGSRGQTCAGGSYRSGGKRERRGLRTELGKLSIETPQIICDVCRKRFRVLGPLLKIAARARPTIGLTQMMAETMTDLSYRKGGSRMAALAQIEIPHSTAHRWMGAGNWDDLQDSAFNASTWKSFQGLIADGTAYKRQKAEKLRGELRLMMGVSGSPRKLVPLGVWVDKGWDEIDQEILAQKPEQVTPPVIVVDGDRGQDVLSNLAQDFQRCQWHIPHQLAFALWKDGLKKPKWDPLINELSGIIKIELPNGDYRTIPKEMRDQIRGQLIEGKEAMGNLMHSFYQRGFTSAAEYLRKANDHTFTVVEKWLELGYMPPKAISLLERVMREMGRRIKKIGASWKGKGLQAVARVLMTRIYDQKRWLKYWQKLLDLHDQCVIKDVSLSLLPM